jgi:hypothetical protein
VAAAAVVVLSSIGIVRLTSEQLSGPSQPGTQAAAIPEAGGITNAAVAPWEVPTYYPVPPRGVRFLVPMGNTRAGVQATMVQGHVVAF